MTIQINDFLDFLLDLKEDEDVGKSIRAKIDHIVELSEKEEQCVFVGKSANIIEEILENPDVSCFTRTQLMEGLTILEQIKL